MKTPHTSCRRGTKVRIVLRTGETIIEKFVERTAQFVVLERRKLRGRDIKSFSIYR